MLTQDFNELYIVLTLTLYDSAYKIHTSQV